MRTKRFPCLLTLVVLLVTSTYAPMVTAGEATWIGTVTVAVGNGTLDRSGEALRIVRGAGVSRGDYIATDSDATICVAMESGPVLTIAPNTKLFVNQIDGAWFLDVINGTTRILHDGKSPLSATVHDCRLSLGRTIVNVQSLPKQMRFELVAGDVTFESAISSPKRFSTPATYATTQRGVLQRELEKSVPMQSSKSLRLVAAMQTTPTLQPPSSPQLTPIPDTTAQAIPLQSPVQDPVLNNNIDDVLEEDDEIQAPPQAAVANGQTRGAAGDSGISDFNSVNGTSNFGGSSSLSLGSLSSSAGTFVSGGLFSDANQQTAQGTITQSLAGFQAGDPFPGAIHMVTGQTQLPFRNVKLSAMEFTGLFPALTGRFFSIGTGAKPTGQVVTNFFTGTDATPNVIDIPRFDAHLIELDQYNIPDPAQGALNNNVGITGLTGATPTSPTVAGATPLVDERAQLNSQATFALGEFLVTPDGTNSLAFSIRRSDQDRLIVKDANNNDANDQVTLNPDVDYESTTDPRFLPQSPSVFQPTTGNANGPLANSGTGINELNLLRRAAFTTLVADQLHDYARRTGQTRFVVDGKIVDISGFRR